MTKVSELTGLRVLIHKKTKTAKDGTVTDKYLKLGKVHNAVFSPDGKRVVGLMIKRPDAVGMIKREDAFLALDAYRRMDEKTLLVTRPDDGMDVAAQRRLALDWDACLIWSGMDAKTVGGKSLGYVSDAEFDEKDGRVARFLTTDGGVAHALIGSFVITPDMVRGYSNGAMVIDPGNAQVQLDGGLAGAAGEGYARAKAGASEVGKKVGAVAGEAVDKGSFALGRALGKAKRAISEAATPEDEPPATPEIPAADVRVEKPAARIAEKGVDPAAVPKKAQPKTYAPTSKKPAAKKKPATTGDKVARAAGKQLSSFGKMFGSFKDEFDKARK